MAPRSARAALARSIVLAAALVRPTTATPPPPAIAPANDANATTRVVWLFWAQGFDAAPPLVKACARSWARRNPGWAVRRLSRASLDEFLPPTLWTRYAHLPAPTSAAFSDVVRTELLRRHGGVWVDATTFAVRALDEWLPGADFFALGRHGGVKSLAGDRCHPTLSSWFLAARRPRLDAFEMIAGRVRAFWATPRVVPRGPGPGYFWWHGLVCELRHEDAAFRRAFDAIPPWPAELTHPRTYANPLRRPMPAVDATHGAFFKLSIHANATGTVLDYFLALDRREAPR